MRGNDHERSMLRLISGRVGIHRRDGDRSALIDNLVHEPNDSTGSLWSPVQTLCVASDDVPYDLSNSEDIDPQRPIELSHRCEDPSSASIERCWQLNYHEAAIFIEEGQNNDKLNFHPCNREALPAYLIVHNTLFYCLDLLSAIVLMSLAVMEKPAIPGLHVSIAFHVSVELLALSVLAVELFMKMRWMGVKPFFSHQRTLFKLMVLGIMFLEAIVVAARQTTHIRVVRALRPIFLIDNHYLGGVRRLIRQILQSLPPVADMLVILFFFMSIFAVLGFHIFAMDTPAMYFNTLYDSFINLFVLLTTSNFPDVMMPYYAQSKWAAFFFIVFLLVHLYFLMNLLLAVVYERFSSLEKEKFRKLLLHRRKACQQAFRLLVNRAAPSCLYFTHFEGLMKFLKPRAKRQDLYLMFKTMDVDRKGFLNKDDFLQIYGACTLTWERQWLDSPWFCELKRPFERRLFQGVYKLATWKWTHTAIYIVIAASFLWHVIEAVEMSSGHASFFGSGKSGLSAWVLIAVLIFYILEVFLKMAAFGVNEYFHRSWNKFDFVIILATIVVGCIGTFFNLNLLRIIVIRSLRLLRLFKLKKRYHDVLGTVFILMPRFVSVGLVLIIVYYFFAIIGIECFAGHKMEDCCRNTTVEVYYATSSNNSGAGYYYLTNFDNIANSYVTLFVLMAVNNWFIIMDGYAAVTSEFSRLFFVFFYLITMIVLQIVVAFVLEAFIFRIQYKMKTGNKQEDNLVKVEMRLAKSEAAFCMKPRGSSISEPLVYPSVAEADTLCYRGTHWRTKFSFCLKMYAEEVKEWLDKAELEEACSPDWVILDPHNSDMNARHLHSTSHRRTFTF